MILHGIVWYYVVCYDVVWHDLTLYCMDIWHGIVMIYVDIEYGMVYWTV